MVIMEALVLFIAVNPWLQIAFYSSVIILALCKLPNNALDWSTAVLYLRGAFVLITINTHSGCLVTAGIIIIKVLTHFLLDRL